MKTTLTIGVLISSFLILVACTPSPAPVPTTQAPTPTPVVAPKATPVVSAEDAAWAKVVAGSKNEGKLTVYSYYLTGDTGNQVKEGLKKATGLDIEIVTGIATQFIEKIKTERRAGFQTASVFDGSVVEMYLAKQQGLSESVGYLPNLTDETLWSKSPRVDSEGYVISTSPNMQSPWINTKLLKPEQEPKSWKELLRPEWKGKIDFSDPDTTSGMVRTYYYLTKYAGLDDAYFRQLGQQVVYSSNNLISADKVGRGEVPLTFSQTFSPMGRYIREGAPVKTIDMEEGIVAFQGVALSLLSNAPNPNAARVYVNWLVSPEGQTVFHKNNGTSSFRKDVPNFLPSPAQLNARKTIWTTPEEEQEVAKLQRDRVLKKLMTEK